jgi:hypothetical protein
MLPTIADKAFRRIDITAAALFFAWAFATRPIAALYAQAGLTPPLPIQWLTGLPLWAAGTLAVLASAVVVGKNYFLRDNTARFIAAVVTMAVVAVGAILLVLALYGPVIQLTNQASKSP